MLGVTEVLLDLSKIKQLFFVYLDKYMLPIFPREADDNTVIFALAERFAREHH